MTTIAIEIKNGMIQAVFSTNPPTRVVIIDYDMGDEDRVNYLEIEPINERVAKILNKLSKTEKK